MKQKALRAGDAHSHEDEECRKRSTLCFGRCLTSATGAQQRARRENVPRHIPFCLADELNIITMQKKTSVTIFEKSLQNAEIFSEPIFLLETEKLLC